VRQVRDISRDPGGIERELVLVKLDGAHKAEALRLAVASGARTIDEGESLVFELTGDRDEIDRFIETMRPFGLTSLSRTGVLSLTRGAD
jgi:acetolactate synthase-1/3 small subunit